MMNTENNQIVSNQRFIGLFEEQRTALLSADTPVVARIREEAFQTFKKSGFPDTRSEAWRHTDLSESLGKTWEYPLQPASAPDFRKVFRCNIPHLDTAVIGSFNGWYVSKDVPLMELGNGMIMGSLAQAKIKYPELVDRYYGTLSQDPGEGFTNLNTAFAGDGVFIYVPDRVKSPKPVQVINVIQHDRNLFLQSRNLIILGDSASLSLVHCDDSYNHQASFSNIVTEIHLGDQATLDHYKLQNLNNESTLISSVYFRLGKGSGLESHFISLNGGLLRNNIRVLFDRPGGNANIYGIYLMDRKQHVDNRLYIDHAYPGCTSNELFKGILDEHAHAVFNGHVMVRRNAVKTDARQTNRNILLTDTARVNSKPFLEIYNDDVKCSHGSTTGQLDADSMFYLRQRGIGEDTARMLLMFAFADEIIAKISIPQLRQRIEDMVKKRLQGELQICEQCVLHCSTPDHPVDFQIDLTKI
ncbi:MAG: Fe-S cluster assembly protein SufD [Alphaproteobacteria bacterium]|nr:Fe-S cluster assembly protein SufD [Alphaproteobacteria bacterium]